MEFSTRLSFVKPLKLSPLLSVYEGVEVTAEDTFVGHFVVAWCSLCPFSPFDLRESDSDVTWTTDDKVSVAGITDTSELVLRIVRF